MHDIGRLTEAFPVRWRPDASIVAHDVAHRLSSPQLDQTFAVRVEGETVRIPERLHFAQHEIAFAAGSIPGLMAWSLQTRSTDGFQRQIATRNIVSDIQPWSVPFVAAQIGDYVIEILNDIDAALTPKLSHALGNFIADNPNYWQLIKQRVVSYWNVYYRTVDRSEYVGFKLVSQIEIDLKSRQSVG